MKNVYGASVLLTITIIFWSPAQAWAVGSAGFENASFSAASLAEGGAVVAQADEPATISYNPAGIINLPGVQVQSTSNFISTTTFVDSPRDSSMKSAGTLKLIPTGYVTINPGSALGDRVALGFGSDSPFGLSNKWDANDTHVHYTGWNNWLRMYTLKPVIAVKFTDWLSMGAGPVNYRIFDFGLVQAYPNVLVPGGLTTDGQIRANLSGNSWGWQYGLLLKPSEKHQFGFYFRSPAMIKLRGLAKVENSTSGNFETGVFGKLNLPMNMTWAYSYSPSDRTTIEADFGYTRWQSFERLYINHDSVNGREDPILNAIGLADKDYEDSYSIHLGGKHRFSDKFTLRAGSWYYSQAVPADHFIPAVPDSNRLGLSIGASIDFTKNMTLDLVYYNAFNLRRKVKNTISESLGTTVDGNYFSYLQNFSISLTYRWDDLFHPSIDAEETTSA